jgi:predicted nucleic acid-binding protein
MRAVVDTNVLIGALYRDTSASARVLRACLGGEIQAVTSAALRAEYAHILPRAVRRAGWEATYAAFLSGCREQDLEGMAAGEESPDPADQMLFDTARAAGAEVLVTLDRVLLQVGSFGVTRIVRPSELAAALGAEG